MLAVLASLGLSLGAAGAAFQGGTLDLSWTSDDALSLRVEVDADLAVAAGASPTWVVTVDARRFADGIYSWQIHVSPTHQSIVVVPNDFLTVRRFGLDQLGVEVVTLEPGRRLELRIPRSGPLSELVAPGDALEVHALWVRQAPLVAVIVPAPASAGAGGAAEAGTPGMAPGETVYVQGTAIRGAFPLVDAGTGKPIEGAFARIALLRKGAGSADGLAAYQYQEPDAETGVLAYEIPTADLEPGAYELVVWVSPPGQAVRQSLEILASP